jgi:hypothetical protein
MAFDIGHAFQGSIPQPQHTQPVTNLSAHVDGGNAPGVNGSAANRSASADERCVLHYSVAIVLVALALLWLMGALAFRGIRL